MAKTLSNSGIVTGQTIKASEISQSIDALTGTEAYDITISGSLTITGSTNIDGDIFFNPSSSTTGTSVLTINPTTGKIFRTGSYSSGGSGPTPSLETVTTAGNTTTNAITTGNITSTGVISASGNLFASVADNNNSLFKVVVYDTATGRFYRTGSYSIGSGGGGGGSVGTLQQVTDSGSSTTNALTIQQSQSNGYESSSFMTLWANSSVDIMRNKGFIDFKFTDTNVNEWPQVRIGAQAGPNIDAGSLPDEGKGAFVVYTNNATGNGPGSPSNLDERFRVDYRGNVGIGSTDPGEKLTVLGNISASGGLNASTLDISNNLEINSVGYLTISSSRIFIDFLPDVDPNQLDQLYTTEINGLRVIAVSDG